MPRVRKVRAYVRSGNRGHNVRGYTTFNAFGGSRRAKIRGTARLSVSQGRVLGGGRALPKTPTKSRRRMPGKRTARGNELRHGKAVMRSKGGTTKQSNAILRTGRQQSMVKPKRRRAAASKGGASVKRTGRSIKEPSRGKTRKAPQTSPSRRASSGRKPPVGDMHQAIRTMAARMPKGPRGEAVGTKGVVRAGPDLRTAEQKRNPRKVRKH